MEGDLHWTRLVAHLRRRLSQLDRVCVLPRAGHPRTGSRASRPHGALLQPGEMPAGQSGSSEGDSQFRFSTELYTFASLAPLHRLR